MESDIRFIDFDKYCPVCKFKDVCESDKLCDSCLETPAREGSEKPEKFEPITEEINPGYFNKIKRVKDYLYEVWYDGFDTEYAMKYLESRGDLYFGACSSVRNGNWYGRNLDWVYDESAEFVVHTPRLFNKFASIGVAGGIGKLTDEFVKSGEKDDIYKLVPFMLQDGINEYGVIANMNVVPLDKGKNISEPKRYLKYKFPGLMLVRCILDHFKTAKRAVEYIRDYISVYFPEALHKQGYELHYMVADKDNTYVLEFVNNEAVIIDISDKPYLTNFYIGEVIFNQDLTVYTPETQDAYHNAIITNKITPRGSGLERYNDICENYARGNSKAGMRSLMDGLIYTKAYTAPSDIPELPFWYTEFVGVRDLTVASDISEYEPVVEIAREYFSERSRSDGGKTWQTVHSSVYDMENRKLYLITQEEGREYSFELR